jgi:hydrogenase expression/formation protein HypC
MCLAIPGKLVEWINQDPLFATAEIEFASIRRVCHMACVPEAIVGDYVLVHAGVAITRVDPAEAQRLLDDLQSLDTTDDWPAEDSSDEIP